MTDVSRLPGPFVDEWSWQQQARCRDVDPALFFHPAGERGPAHDHRDAVAKRVCAGCPVREPCAEYALRTREPYGVWGGLTEHERRAVLARRRALHRRQRAA
ncbi:WhiB family transcriptional regulator [Streptacidiphilus monticola]|jgi:WhiB family redox-sensing transcriptional regulator|uniref:Transcriptional regulator WhiB n=1 Tax=Streptacidiphilus monticola TaxID=2161674 RepID=A0ABW1FXM4_9ACTN